MRLRNDKIETGHLLSFVLKSDHSDNFSLFFPVEGLDQFDALLEITRGFEKCLEAWPSTYDYTEYSIADYKNIKETIPEIDPTRIIFFEPSEFLSKESKLIEPFGKALLKRFVQKKNLIFPDIFTGAMAAGSSFYDREAVIQNIWDLIQGGKNIMLRAPRRFGKTSLLNHIAKNPQEGWQVCFVDLEGGDSAEKFVEKILAALFAKENFEALLPDHLTGQHIYKMTQLEQLSVLREERKAIQKEWKAYAETLFNHVAERADNHFLFILDELSFLIEDMLDQRNNSAEDIAAFMNWFHELRCGLEKIRVILTGSEHLPFFLSAYGIESRFDDLEQVHLDLFDQETTEEFIFLVLAGQKVVAEIEEIHLMQDLMGKPIPYFLQLFLDALCRTCREKKVLTPDDIRSVYDHHLLGPESKRYFESITRQLDRYNRYGPRNSAGARSILDRLAIDEQPVPAEALEAIWSKTTGDKTQFKTILDIMRDDMYIEHDESGRVFIDSKLIKEWWRKHGVAGPR